MVPILSPFFKPTKSSIGLILGFYAHHDKNYPLFVRRVVPCAAVRVRILFYTRASLTPIQIPCFDQPSVNVCVFFQRAQLGAARHIVLSRLHYSIEPSFCMSPLLRVQNHQYIATLCRRWLCVFCSKSRAQWLCVDAHFVQSLVRRCVLVKRAVNKQCAQTHMQCVDRQVRIC